MHGSCAGAPRPTRCGPIIGGAIILGASGYVVGRISSALAPFVLAFLFALFLQGPVGSLSARGMSRGLAAALCFVVVFVVVSLALFVLLPPLGRQMVEFANAVPGLVDEGRRLLAQSAGADESGRGPRLAARRGPGRR